MTDSQMSEQWQDTVDLAVALLEKRTGLKLAGLSQSEITQQVREWLKAKGEAKSADRP